MNKQDLVEIIGRCTREVLPGLDSHVFRESDRLVQLGANSIDRAEIVMMVQETLNLSVPRVELFGPTNVGELADLLLHKLHGR
jgi:polyketide biosynthesis acyl carrier protein